MLRKEDKSSAPKVSFIRTLLVYSHCVAQLICYTTPHFTLAILASPLLQTSRALVKVGFYLYHWDQGTGILFVELEYST